MSANSLDSPAHGASLNKLVSIIVTSYNHAAFLDQRMESLLRQTYSPIEMIVIDDHSKDGSRDVLEKYRGLPTVTIVFNEENSGGYVQACNQGMRMARGEYAMIAQSDDFNEPTHVDRLVRALDRHPGAGVAFCRSELIDGRGRVIGNDFVFREPRFRKMCENDVFLSGEEMAKFLLISCVIPNLSAALFKKELYEKLNGLSEHFGMAADWDFWSRMSRETDFYYVAEPLNRFRTHEKTIRASYPACREMEEFMGLLFDARAHLFLPKRDERAFKANLGSLWVDSIVHNPLHWVLHWAEGAKLMSAYDGNMFFYVGLGFLERIKRGIVSFCPSRRGQGVPPPIKRGV